jgi:tRNA-dihydrouridine synthase B
VLAHTRADGVMIGRAAHGRPWIFAEIAHFLATGHRPAPMSVGAMRAIVLEHLEGLYALYGEQRGLRVARKHIGWYVKALPGGEALRREVNCIESAAAQQAAVGEYYARLAGDGFAQDAARNAPANDNCERRAA